MVENGVLPDDNYPEASSSGHRLGQIIGDWWERYICLPLLQTVGDELQVFTDNRYVQRSCRSGKIAWKDADANSVDYDFVLELEGQSDRRGIPVAFVECFWRRGARHSKDKARDDSGKLRPMRETYPTARYLGILAAGDFTEPARLLVKNNQINLFYIPKAKVVQSFSQNGLTIDYADSSDESKKAALVRLFEKDFNKERRTLVAQTLREVVGHSTFQSFIQSLKAALSALPQLIELMQSTHSDPVTFSSLHEATSFLEKRTFTYTSPNETYRYKVIYSDGTEFMRELASIESLRSLHLQTVKLADHMSKVL